MKTFLGLGLSNWMIWITMIIFIGVYFVIIIKYGEKGDK